MASPWWINVTGLLAENEDSRQRIAALEAQLTEARAEERKRCAELMRLWVCRRVNTLVALPDAKRIYEMFEVDAEKNTP